MVEDAVMDVVDAALRAKYIDVATTCLVFYDWATALGDEVDLVWKAPSRPLPRFIFILLRYTTLAAQPVTLLYDFFQPHSLMGTCPLYLRTIMGLTYVVLTCSELIIMLRLLSVYRTNLYIYRSLWTAYTIAMIVSIVVIGIWAKGLHFMPQAPMAVLPGCWTVVSGKELFAAFGVIVVWELGISIISYWRTWNTYVSTGTPFWELFFKTGGHFYLWVLGISWINIALIGSSAHNHEVQVRMICVCASYLMDPYSSTIAHTR